MSEVLVAAREFACAAEPLVTHLPAIIAALEEAADYRDYYGWCPDCSPQPGGSRCADHARDQAVLAAYEAARHAIIRLTT
ncbi:hypothetical protein [Actinoallomurus iriomotensis]|nr:hypothetical protein [Actinoallomurus iriomotensis]